MTLDEEAGGQLAIHVDAPEAPIPEGTPCDTYCPHGDDIERDGRWGRPRVDGHYRTRVSTLAGTLEDDYAIGLWKMRHVLLGANASLREQALGQDPTTTEGRKALNEMAQEALELAGGQEAADAGTTAHDWMALYAQTVALEDGYQEHVGPAGEYVSEFPWEFIPDAQAQDLLALADGLRASGLRFTPLVEQFVAGPEWAGTLDLGLQDSRGRWWLADLKTSAKDWDRRHPSKVAVQLAAYGQAQRWCPHHGYLPTPDWYGYLLLSVPLGSGSCYVTKIKKRSAIAGLNKARMVRAWRARKDLARPYKQHGER